MWRVKKPTGLNRCCLPLLIFSILLVLNSVVSLPDDPGTTYEQYFLWGKQTYTTESWEDCVNFMQRALEDYEYFRDETRHCRKECNNEIPEISAKLGPLSEMQVKIIVGIIVGFNETRFG